MFRFSSSRTRSGFTLIELLVVIAIIAILAAILFPVFAKAREKARQTSCLSNLKQLGLAVLQYTQDYDERFPWYRNVAIAGYNDGVCSGGQSYLSTIIPYVKNVQIFTCPSTTPTPTFTYGTSNMVQTSNYLMNHALVLDANYNTLALNNADSARFIMMSEYRNYHTAFYGYLPPSTDNWPIRNGIYAHNDGTNLVFADGHAKWENKSSFATVGAVYNAIGLRN
jgi:prepilin-type N-terminal cleavage/methylation domain-containing protein/prepilin-type processing-associated H-X9-DG protein